MTTCVLEVLFHLASRLWVQLELQKALALLLLAVGKGLLLFGPGWLELGTLSSTSYQLLVCLLIGCKYGENNLGSVLS